MARICEVKIKPLMIPCGNPTDMMYEATCSLGHITIKWACQECVDKPYPTCGACAKEGRKYSPVDLKKVEEG
jgi:hypothetical protein